MMDARHPTLQRACRRLGLLAPILLLAVAGCETADHKKKGDFHKNGKDDVGGNAKQDNSRNPENHSRTGGQTAGHGGHK